MSHRPFVGFSFARFCLCASVDAEERHASASALRLSCGPREMGRCLHIPCWPRVRGRVDGCTRIARTLAGLVHRVCAVLPLLQRDLGARWRACPSRAHRIEGVCL